MVINVPTQGRAPSPTRTKGVHAYVDFGFSG